MGRDQPYRGRELFGDKAADVTLTVGKTGKISGKFVAAGKQYPFTAASFKTCDEDGVLRAQATMKYGTKTCKVEIAVAEGEGGGGEAAVAVTGAVEGSGALALP